MPIALAIGATLTPETVRIVLLIVGVASAAWTIHRTEWANRNLKNTGKATTIFILLGVGVFVLGHVMDARGKSPKENGKSAGPTAAHPRQLHPEASPTLLDKPTTPSELKQFKQAETVAPNKKAGDRVKRQAEFLTPAPLPQTPPPTIYAPGGVVSVNQQGGMTVGQIFVITNTADPQFKFVTISENDKIGDLYESKILMSISTRVPVPNLEVKVAAPTVKRMQAVQQRAGGGLMGNSGSRDGYCFTNIPNAYGSYMLVMHTEKPERFEVTYDPQYQ